jgi:hypothetical protein
VKTPLPADEKKRRIHTAQRVALNEPQEEQLMDDIDALIEALRTVFANLEHLKNIEGHEFQVSGSVAHYQSLLEDAYAAYDRVETTVEELGQALEYEHARLEKAVKQSGEAD